MLLHVQVALRHDHRYPEMFHEARILIKEFLGALPGTVVRDNYETLEADVEVPRGQRAEARAEELRILLPSLAKKLTAVAWVHVLTFEPTVPPETQIEDLGLPLKVQNLLKSRFDTVAQACRYSYRELGDIPNLGSRGISYLRAALAGRGYWIRGY